MLKLDQNDMVVFGINVYNEGSVGAFAKEIKDVIPQGLVFVTDSEINKKNGWRRLDADGNRTFVVTKAVSVVTDKLKDKCIDALSFNGKGLTVSNGSVEVEFKVVEPQSEDRILENRAEVTKFHLMIKILTLWIEIL